MAVMLCKWLPDDSRPREDGPLDLRLPADQSVRAQGPTDRQEKLHSFSVVVWNFPEKAKDKAKYSLSP